MTYTVSGRSRPAWRARSPRTDAKPATRLVTTYITDPASDTVLMQTRLEAPSQARAYEGVRPAPVRAVGCARQRRRRRRQLQRGRQRRDDRHVDRNPGAGRSPALTRSPRPSTATTRCRLHGAEQQQPGPGAASVGYAGTASDGLTQLDTSHALTPTTPRRTATSWPRRTSRPATDGVVTLALGFGRTQASGGGHRAAPPWPARLPWSKLGTWPAGRPTTAGCAGRRRTFPGLSGAQASDLRRRYYLSANVLKASEDKTYPGAIVASLASPWGQAVPAGTAVNGKPVYFGSYREVFSRDLYEAFTGLLTDGDLATARAATLFLFDHQQLAERPAAAELAGQRGRRTRHRRNPAGRDRLPDPDGAAVGTGRRYRAMAAAHPAQRPTSWSRGARRSARSGGRSSRVTHRRRSPRRSPG